MLERPVIVAHIAVHGEGLAMGPRLVSALIFSVGMAAASCVATATAVRAQAPLSDAAFFEAPAAPIDVQAVGDDRGRAAAVIGPDGGKIATTGADGARYELSIPPGALVLATEIAIIPITTIRGAPVQVKNMPGIIIEPEGIVLREIATLTITKPGLDPKEVVGAIAGYGRGQDLRLTLARVETGTAIIPVEHFTIFRISAEDMIKDARQREAQDRLKHKFAARFIESLRRAIERDEERQLERKRQHEKQIFDLFTAYKAFLAQAALQMTGNPQGACHTLRKGLAAFRQLHKMGVTLTKAGADELPEKIFTVDLSHELVALMKTTCRKEAERICAATFDTSAITEEANAESVVFDSDLFDFSNWEREAIKRCSSFVIIVETTGKGIHTDVAACTQPVELAVVARIPVTLDRGRIVGSGGHAVTKYTHSLKCTRHDNAQQILADTAKPMTARVVTLKPPLVAHGDTPLPPPTVDVFIDPGLINMKWKLWTSFGSHTASYDEWWRDNFSAHHSSRRHGAEFRFELPVTADRGGGRSAVFTSNGTWTDITGTWRGTETTRITLLPGGQ
jgi:hypothetical protein